MSFLTLIREREQKRAALREDAIKEVQRLSEHLKKLYLFEAVYLCGSVVSGAFGRHSDIDLVIEGLKIEDFFKAYAFLIKESSYDIDLKPFEDIDKALRLKVLSEGIRVG